jgi:hypothetical protein
MDNLIKLSLDRILLSSIIFLCATFQPANAAEFSEDQVKAVFLINFAEFIRWPDNSFSENPKQFYFCAFHSKTPVISILKRVIANESARGRKLIFKQIGSQEELKDCQVFYFNSSDQSRFIEYLPLLQQRSILTVSDNENFIHNGGMIAITKNRRRLHPTINVSNLKKAGLKASAKLLELATLTEND